MIRALGDQDAGKDVIYSPIHIFMSKKLHFLVLGVLLFVPFTLHSTDIYTSSHGEVKILANLNPHIIPGHPKLGNTILIVSAPNEQKEIRLITACEHKETILHKEPNGNKKTIYVIQVIFPTSCEIPHIRVGDRENIFTDTLFSLPLESFGKMENSLINTGDSELLNIMRNTPVPPRETIGVTLTEKLRYLQTIYKDTYTTLRSDIARTILQSRGGTGYISPVAGYNLPQKDKLIPGALRSYRKDTTDGIHHGWDIMAPTGTPVQALSKGRVIRVVNDWNWNKFRVIKKGNLTKDDQLQNLDIFRGNQVWLQTMDGNVTFYSHLSRISPDIMVGSLVGAGTYLGNVGISGVPDKNYKDVHLHFEIQQNPFHKDMKNPTHLEIMRWNFVGENMKRREIYAKMQEIFG
ncbi:TPA: hypothetical protein DCZ36_02925 [Candidatus Gracilibacteria bacterium]|nr:hypothetical protein [Candidatus Gracilibacteria bacterium]